MPLQATSGAASYDAFGGGVAAVPNYIEDVFSTWLYTGTGAAQTITNGIDLSTKGGLVWMKDRGSNPSYQFNVLVDTARPGLLISNSTDAETGSGLTTYNTDGFRINAGYTAWNSSGQNYASWTFRKQPKFFDIVTYTGNGGNLTVSHSLGSVPGCIIIKRVDSTSDWTVGHRGNGSYWASEQLLLNSTAAGTTNASFTSWTSTSFGVTYSGASYSDVNTNGGTYVAYLFAHDAGGFGLTGTDNVISCGSFTTDGSGNATVNLGYEPQWVLIKQTDGVDSWYLNDNMRGMAVSGNQPNLSPNLSAAESAGGYNTYPNATGFTASVGIASKNYIYIAIRRGPMKVPTDATTVFIPNATTASINTKITTNFPVDLQMQGYRPGFSGNIQTIDRLRGTGTVASSTSSVPKISTSSTAAESSVSAANGWDNTGFQISTGWDSNNMVYWNFQRAPSFFDEVCYTGTGSNLTLPHNLTVAPELIIAKVRSTSSSWGVSTSTDWTKYLLLNSTNAQASASLFGTPDATNFYPTASGGFSGSGNTYVAYLFASCAGVQYINSYVGDGTTGRTINCGFTGGARFVCIKATSTSGSWWTFDSARGIVTNSDPALQLNSTAAEVTSADAIDTASSGFIVNQEATCSLNASGVSYLVWAIA